MVVAGDTIFIAGRPDIIMTQAEKGYGALILENPQQALDAWQGKKGALLWSVSAKDGRKLAEYKLKSIAARFRRYGRRQRKAVRIYTGWPPALHGRLKLNIR